jgi:hypothetical protein
MESVRNLDLRAHTMGTLRWVLKQIKIRSRKLDYLLSARWQRSVLIWVACEVDKRSSLQRVNTLDASDFMIEK